MKDMKKTTKQEKELEQLFAISERIQAAKKPTLSDATRQKIADIPGPRRSWIPTMSYSLAAGALGVFIVMVLVAQNATPNSPLYWLKQGTEQVRALVEPGFADDAVDIRKEEIEELEKQGATELEIIEAEDAYIEALEKSSEEKQQAEEESGNVERYTEYHWRNYDRNSWDDDSDDEKDDSDSWRDSDDDRWDDDDRDNNWGNDGRDDRTRWNSWR